MTRFGFIIHNSQEILKKRKEKRSNLFFFLTIFKCFSDKTNSQDSASAQINMKMMKISAFIQCHTSKPILFHQTTTLFVFFW